MRVKEQPLLLQSQRRRAAFPPFLYRQSVSSPVNLKQLTITEKRHHTQAYQSQYRHRILKPEGISQSKSSFYRQENRGSVRLSKLLQVTQHITGQTRESPPPRSQGSRVCFSLHHTASQIVLIFSPLPQIVFTLGNLCYIKKVYLVKRISKCSILTSIPRARFTKQYTSVSDIIPPRSC